MIVEGRSNHLGKTCVFTRPVLGEFARHNAAKARATLHKFWRICKILGILIARERALDIRSLSTLKYTDMPDAVWHKFLRYAARELGQPTRDNNHYCENIIERLGRGFCQYRECNSFAFSYAACPILISKWTRIPRQARWIAKSEHMRDE